MWLRGFVITSVLLGLVGCSTPKKALVSPKTLLVSSIDTLTVLPKESLSLNVDPLVQVESLEDTVSLVTVPTILDLTTEDKVIEQKKTGVNKEVDWAAAIHYDLRKPNFVIIHHTSQNSIAQTIRTFQVPHTKVSAHYVIGRDGLVVQMLNDYDRAWHAGSSKWGSVTDINSISIGIELDNNGSEPFPEEQINALIRVLANLKSKYLIPQLNFIGHSDIAPTRKNDPNVFFPWKLLADRGFGIWYNEDYLMSPPENFNPIDALKIMGYDMRNPEAAIRAFKRKFIIKEVNGLLTAHDKAVLFDLYRKYY